MADLFDANAAPIAPQRMTLAQQALANLLGVTVCSLLMDERCKFALQLVTETLPAARIDVPAWYVPVLSAAEAAALFHAQDQAGQVSPGGWSAVANQAERALSDFFWGRASAALDAHRQREADNAA